MSQVAFLRSLLGGVVFLIVTLIFSLLMVIFPNKGWGRILQNGIISLWGWSALILFGIRLEVLGREHLTPGQGLLLFNHSSFVDIFAMAAAYSDFRFGAKVELFKIPIFGAAMRRCGVLPIARQSREEVFKVYAEARDRALAGEKFALSPEGGRNVDGELLPFKAGPFIFAINSQMPLIPTVIQGAYDVMKKGSLLPNADRWRRTIRISFLEPISVKGVSLEERGKLQELSHARMRDYIRQSPLPSEASERDR